jgi:hypothetical protein
MKTIIKVLLLSVVTSFSYSQSRTVSKSNKESIKNIDLPEIVVKSNVKNDLTVYLRDINVDSKVVELQDEFIKYELGEKIEGYKDTFVIFELKRGDGKLVAFYNENGKLTSVAEQYKNVELPISVSRSVYKAYPGWQIEKDKYVYTQENGSVTNKEYILTMTKDKRSQKVTVNPINMVIASR